MTDDDLGLPPHDLPPRSAERIRRVAQGALSRERRLASRPWIARGARLWNRRLEPALTAGVVLIYLSWLATALRTLV